VVSTSLFWHPLPGLGGQQGVCAAQGARAGASSYASVYNTRPIGWLLFRCGLGSSRRASISSRLLGTDRPRDAGQGTSSTSGPLTSCSFTEKHHCSGDLASAAGLYHDLSTTRETPSRSVLGLATAAQPCTSELYADRETSSDPTTLRGRVQPGKVHPGR
jgi:hypothetical protein